MAAQQNPALSASQITVSVRWLDSYMEKFEATETRTSPGLLWMRLVGGSERCIPLVGVRWFSRTPESHEATP